MSFRKCPPKKENEGPVSYLLVRIVYNLFGWPSFIRRLQWPIFNDILEVQDGMVVVDLGAGQMQYSVELVKNLTATIIAIDVEIPEGMGNWAQSNGVRIMREDGRSLSLDDHSVDCIIMSSLIQMVQEPELLLHECRRVLKRNGHLILSVPNHYNFIPSLFQKDKFGIIRKLLGAPRRYEDFIDLLNGRFKVGGPKGYYSFDELNELLKQSHFRIEKHFYSPGWLGSLLWELGVLAYVRFGNIAFHLLFLAYPVARLYDILVKSRTGSEHIVKVIPENEY